MLTPEEEHIGKYKGTIIGAANRFRHAAEYDDLYQEGMIAVWLCPPDSDPQYVSQAVYNRLKNWVRFIKRLRHHQSASYWEVGVNYTEEIVENLLRNYYSLQAHTDSTFSPYKVDLDKSLERLKSESVTLYNTIVNVFINSKPITAQATDDGVTNRQVTRRLHDGLYMLTLIMNGEYYDES